MLLKLAPATYGGPPLQGSSDQDVQGMESRARRVFVRFGAETTEATRSRRSGNARALGRVQQKAKTACTTSRSCRSTASKMATAGRSNHAQAQPMSKQCIAWWQASAWTISATKNTISNDGRSSQAPAETEPTCLLGSHPRISRLCEDKNISKLMIVATRDAGNTFLACNHRDTRYPLVASREGGRLTSRQKHHP